MMVGVIHGYNGIVVVVLGSVRHFVVSDAVDVGYCCRWLQ